MTTQARIARLTDTAKPLMADNLFRGKRKGDSKASSIKDTRKRAGNAPISSKHKAKPKMQTATAE